MENRKLLGVPTRVFCTTPFRAGLVVGGLTLVVGAASITVHVTHSLSGDAGFGFGLVFLLFMYCGSYPVSVLNALANDALSIHYPVVKLALITVSSTVFNSMMTWVGCILVSKVCNFLRTRKAPEH